MGTPLNKNSALRSGFSLLEIMVVLILLLSLGAVAVPAIEGLMTSNTQRETCAMVKAAAVDARAEVMRTGKAAKLVAAGDSSGKRAWHVMLEWVPESQYPAPESPVDDRRISRNGLASSADTGLDERGLDPDSRSKDREILELPAGWHFDSQGADEDFTPEGPRSYAGSTSADAGAVNRAGTMPRGQESFGSSPDSRVTLAVLWPSGESGGGEVGGVGGGGMESAAFPGDEEEFNRREDGGVGGSGIGGGVHLVSPRGVRWNVRISRWTGAWELNEVGVLMLDRGKTDAENCPPGSDNSSSKVRINPP